MVADALSRTGVPKTVMPLIADLDRMGVSFCYMGTACDLCLSSHLCSTVCVTLNNMIVYLRRFGRGFWMVDLGTLA